MGLTFEAGVPLDDIVSPDAGVSFDNGSWVAEACEESGFEVGVSFDTEISSDAEPWLADLAAGEYADADGDSGLSCEDGASEEPRAVVGGSVEEPEAEGEVLEGDSTVGVNRIVGFEADENAGSDGTGLDA